MSENEGEGMTMTNDEMIEVIAGHRDGKRVQFVRKRNHDEDWADCPDPIWDFVDCDYRLAPEPSKPVPPGDLTWEEARRLASAGATLQAIDTRAECGIWFDIEAPECWPFVRHQFYAYRRKPAPVMVELEPEVFIPGTVLRAPSGSEWLVVCRVNDQLSLVWVVGGSEEVKGHKVTPLDLFRDGWLRTPDGGLRWVRCEKEAK